MYSDQIGTSSSLFVSVKNEKIIYPDQIKLMLSSENTNLTQVTPHINVLTEVLC